MPRPLFNHAIATLEALFVESKTNIHTLKELEHELQHRQTLRAGSLCAKVKAALHSAATAPTRTQASTLEPVTSSQSKSPQSVIWKEPVAGPTLPKEPPMQSSVAHRATLERTGAVVAPPYSSTNLISSAPVMSLDEAYKVLKVTPSSSWESVEKARRHLVQQTYPEHIANVREERRALLQIEADRVNAAYAILWQQRLSTASS